MCASQPLPHPPDLPTQYAGGLGDVVGGLPIELVKRGHTVMTVAPRFDQYEDAWDTSVTLNVDGQEVGGAASELLHLGPATLGHKVPPAAACVIWGPSTLSLSPAQLGTCETQPDLAHAACKAGPRPTAGLAFMRSLTHAGALLPHQGQARRGPRIHRPPLVPGKGAKGVGGGACVCVCVCVCVRACVRACVCPAWAPLGLLSMG